MKTSFDILNNQAMQFARFLREYKSCSPEIRAVVDDMADIIVDESADRDEKQHAAATVVEALFPREPVELTP